MGMVPIHRAVAEPQRKGGVGVFAFAIDQEAGFVSRRQSCSPRPTNG